MNFESRLSPATALGPDSKKFFAAFLQKSSASFPFLRRLALLATLLLPLGLLDARAGAEIAIGVIDILFLTVMARTGSWAWLRQPWVIIALAWWGWEVVCSTPVAPLGQSGWAGLVQALVLGRLIILAAALQSWVLTTPASRRLAWFTIALACLWIGVESWQQYLLGHNLFGDPRWGDGALTGPFTKPRAGAPYAHLLLPSLLPVVIPWLERRRLAGIALAVLGIATSVLIGQRMPTALAVLALASAALFIRRLRPAAAAAIIIAAAVLLATPFISPHTYAKLVGETSRQMSHFTLSPYGQLYIRATTMGLASPAHGYGFNGFRAFCTQPQFATGFPGLGIPATQLGLGACNIHPHNFYLQAFTDAGLPGLLLFAALNLAWLAALSRRLWRAPDPLRVGLFAAVLTYAWPFASTDSFATLPMAGWLFLLLGLGLASAHIPLNFLIADD